jgi:hypothetical protein
MIRGGTNFQEEFHLTPPAQVFRDTSILAVPTCSVDVEKNPVGLPTRYVSKQREEIGRVNLDNTEQLKGYSRLAEIWKATNVSVNFLWLSKMELDHRQKSN